MSHAQDPQTSANEGEGTLLSHLLELRTRLLRMVLGVLVIFIALAPFANPIYTFVAGPLMAHLPEGNSMIAIDVAAPFLIPFKLVLMLSIILAIPYLLYQIWAFVAPGLYQHERSIALPLIASSTLLFYVGMAFAYFVVFPLIFAFFTSTAPEGVAVMTDIGRYLDFIILLFLAFGIAFEVPIATILVVRMGLTTPQKLAAKRPYVIVGAFVVGMLLTPPDIISQTLLALPVWLLFEIGVLLSRFMVKHDPDESADASDFDDAPPSGPGAGAGFGTTSASNAAPDLNTQGWDQMAGHHTAHAEKRFEYTPLSPEAMDAELDRIEREEQKPVPQKTPPGD